MSFSKESVTASQYFAVYAHMVRMLVPTRDSLLTTEQGISRVADLAWNLAQTHLILDRHRFVSREYEVTDAIHRADQVTSGAVDAVVEAELLSRHLRRVLSDAVAVVSGASA
jgi:hypothetical protein